MKIMSDINGRYYERRSSEERFWEKVVKTENCWIWNASKTKSGYGKFNSSHEQSFWEKAHRYSWKLHFGEIPEGKVVCHTCNFKLCVRPDHLYIATSRENTQDAMRDGLCPVGEKHGMAKITEDDVKAIRALYKPREVTLETLGKRYGLTKTQVLRIVKFKTWRHVPPTA